MTEAEAPAHIERLKRIWVPKHETAYQLIQIDLKQIDESLSKEDECIYGHIELLDEVKITFASSLWRFECTPERQGTRGILICNSEVGRVMGKDKDSPLGFVVEYLPFFRRNCWLSGAPIEATAHEKLEWMQGFTSQEIQAWNLQF